MKRIVLYLALAAVFSLALAPAAARADGDAEEVMLEFSAPGEANLGDTVIAEARLTDHSGRPIQGATVKFLSPAMWSAEFQGEMEIGEAVTDSDGVAAVRYQMRRSGQVSLIARYGGSADYEETEAQAALQVAGDYQLYLPKFGIDAAKAVVPWLIILAIAFVWGLYFLVGTKVLAIARAAGPAVAAAAASLANPSRRRFLSEMAVPVGMLAAIVGLGSGLMTLVARSPYTHANLEKYPTRSGYRRTPLTLVGREMEMKEMPPVLERQISFSQEIVPIFRAKGGPHVYLPENSPVPGGIRLDAYEHIMEKEDLIVPGKPEASSLVGVLLDRSMGMPPAGELLSDDEVELVVSWIAQGANNN